MCKVNTPLQQVQGSFFFCCAVAVCRLYLAAASGGYALVVGCGLLTVMASLAVEHRLRALRLQ